MSWWAVVAGIATVLGIVTFILEWVIRPLSRLVRRVTKPQRLADAMRSLQTGVNLQHFTDALGQPPTRGGNTQHLYILEQAFVEVHTDDYGNVGRFTVTTRQPDFNPVMSMGGGGDVVLGNTTYTDLGLDGWASGLAVMQSPAGRHTSYAEAYYFGNPGNYQTWVLATIAAGAYAGGAADYPDILKALDADHFIKFGWSFSDERPPEDMPDGWYTRPPIKRFRETVPINTFSETGPHGNPDSVPGPDVDEVRAFRGPEPDSIEDRLRYWVVAVFVVLIAAAVVVIDKTAGLSW